MIEIKSNKEGDPWEFTVRVQKGTGETRHRVTVAKSTYEELSRGEIDPERLVEAAFEFLLEREPKESILRSFDITDISRYFPDFEMKIQRYFP